MDDSNTEVKTLQVDGGGVFFPFRSLKFLTEQPKIIEKGDHHG
jgi:hypothetical protein